VTFSVNYDDYVFDSCTSLTSVTVTGGLVSGGETIPNGVIDMYFRSGLDDDVNWKLGYGVNVTTLFLPDIVSLDYDPNNEDGKGGIAGAEGRVLSYKDAEYICSGTSDWELVACSLFGTVKDTDGNPVSGATVILELNSGTYSALTGIDGGYMISGIPAGTYGTITASKIGYYLTDSVSVLPLTESVRTDMAVTASERLTEYYVSFGFGSDCTAYVNGSPVSSSPIGVTGGGSLSFTVQTPEGYSAVPAVSGMADLLKQSDGSYVIRNIYSNLSVTVTVSADIRSGPDVNPGDSSGNGSDNGSGNDSSGNGSGGDSSDGIPYWVPVLIAGAFIVCIAAVLIVRRSRNRQ
jgi:hypothetical protein